MVVAGVVALSWLGFVTHSMQAAVRDRERLASLYAAEAGIEMVVDWFNNPENFEQVDGGNLFSIPDMTLTWQAVDGATGETTQITRTISGRGLVAHPPEYSLDLPVHPAPTYRVFQPFLQDYLKDRDGYPVTRDGERIWSNLTNSWADGRNSDDIVPVKYTYFFPRGGGTPDGGAFDSIAAVSRRSKIPSMSIVFDDVRTDGTDNDRDRIRHVDFRFENDTEYARLQSLRLVHFADPEFGPLPGDLKTPVITKVIATGISASGIRTTLESYITENRVPEIVSPGAILAPDGVGFSGQANVRWGEIWTYNDNILPSNWTSHFPRFGETYGTHGNTTTDPWFRFRTRGVFLHPGGTLFADGRQDSNNPHPRGFAPDRIQEDAGIWYTNPYHTDEMTGQNQNIFSGFDNLQQNQDITITPRVYQNWKDFFLEFGLPYYFTDASGNIYGRDRDPDSPTYGELVSNDFNGWFDSDASASDYWDYENLFIFIDSVPVDDNGNPGPRDENGVPIINETYYPRDPTQGPPAMMATISDSGRGTHTRGVIFAAANLDMAGQGKATHWDEIRYLDGSHMVLMPDGLPPTNLSNQEDNKLAISHNGLLHTWGRVSYAGQRTIYGSIQADAGFGSGDDAGYESSGTPSVYYNYRMGDGSWLSLNQSLVRRSLWNIVDNAPVD